MIERYITNLLIDSGADFHYTNTKLSVTLMITEPHSFNYDGILFNEAKYYKKNKEFDRKHDRFRYLDINVNRADMINIEYFDMAKLKIVRLDK